MENKYRSQMDLTWSAIEAADSTLKRWRRKYQEWRKDESVADKVLAQSLIDDIISILSNDLDTPKAIIKLREIERDEAITGQTRADVFEALDQFFALNISRELEVRTLEVDEQVLLDERILARANKDFARSDSLRDQLLLKNIRVIDTPGGQTWESID
jgi:cysteinyl-tRNA synthetase